MPIKIGQNAKRRITLHISPRTTDYISYKISRGVARYARIYHNWNVHLMNEAEHPNISELGAGVLLHQSDLELTKTIVDSGIPCVNMYEPASDIKNVPSVLIDQTAMGRAGADHLLERGFKSFGFVDGYSKLTHWADKRMAGFVNRIRENGREVSVAKLRGVSMGQDMESVEARVESLKVFLAKLPKPAAIMIGTDRLVQSVYRACESLYIAVPEDVAVLGCGNESIFCETCNPTLSSVIHNIEATAFRASELLDQIITGKRQVPSEPILMPPSGVEIRPSTDTYAIDDRIIAHAIRFIHANVNQDLHVEDVIAQSKLSRSILESRFRKHLGHSPKVEIRRSQVKRIKQLLIDTDMTLQSIAELMNFEHSEYMSVVFKRLTGISPGQYRRENQASYNLSS